MSGALARFIPVLGLLGLAACSGSDETPEDAGVTPSACGVESASPAAECAGLDQCGQWAQNFKKDPTCDNCPYSADSHLCESGTCRELGSLELVSVLLSVPTEAVGAEGFTIATLNPIMADGSKVTCEGLLSSSCRFGDDPALNFTNSTHKRFGGGGASTGMVYQTGISAEPGSDRIVFVQATEEQSGDGAVLAWACVEGVTVPLPSDTPRLAIQLVAK